MSAYQHMWIHTSAIGNAYKCYNPYTTRTARSKEKKNKEMDTAAAPVHLKEMEKGRAAAAPVHLKDGQTGEFERADLRSGNAEERERSRRWWCCTTVDSGRQWQGTAARAAPVADGRRGQSIVLCCRSSSTSSSRKAGSRRQRLEETEEVGREERRWGTAAAAVGNDGGGGGGWVFLTLARSRREMKWSGLTLFHWFHWSYIQWQFFCKIKRTAEGTLVHCTRQAGKSTSRLASAFADPPSAFRWSASRQCFSTISCLFGLLFLNSKSKSRSPNK